MSADNCTVVARHGGRWGVWNNQSMSAVCDDEWTPYREPDRSFRRHKKASMFALDANYDEYHEYGVVEIDA